MELHKHKDFQTIRLFAILAGMTLLLVLLFKVVLFAPQANDPNRKPAENTTPVGPTVPQPKK